MITKILFFLLAGCLLGLATWLVQRNNAPIANSQEMFAPVAHGPAPKASQANEETVRKGLEYLAKSQFKDGHWEGDGGKHPVVMTGLAGLALFMERTPPHGDVRPPAKHPE